MIEAADTEIPTYSPTYSHLLKSSPVAVLRGAEQIFSNDVDLGLPGGNPWRGRMRNRGLRRDASEREGCVSHFYAAPLVFVRIMCSSWACVCPRDPDAPIVVPPPSSSWALITLFSCHDATLPSSVAIPEHLDRHKLPLQLLPPPPVSYNLAIGRANICSLSCPPSPPPQHTPTPWCSKEMRGGVSIPGSGFWQFGQTSITRSMRREGVSIRWFIC